MGQRVGAQVKFAVIQRLLAYLCGNRLRRALFDTLLQRQAASEVRRLRIEVLQQVRALFERQHVELFGRGQRRLIQRFQQMLHRTLQISADALRVNLR